MKPITSGRKKRKELTHDEIWAHPLAAAAWGAIFRWQRLVYRLPMPTGEALDKAMRERIEVLEENQWKNPAPASYRGRSGARPMPSAGHQASTIAMTANPAARSLRCSGCARR
jgi:hypothetical protein